jgi:hypothetical protein
LPIGGPLIAPIGSLSGQQNRTGTLPPRNRCRIQTRRRVNLRNYLIAYLVQGRQALPDTAMAAAFLQALMRLVEAPTDNPTATTVLPTGEASIGELKVVLRNLNLTN